MKFATPAMALIAATGAAAFVSNNSPVRSEVALASYLDDLGRASSAPQPGKSGISSYLDGVSSSSSHAVGSGGMADTRNPEASNNEDPRKSISAAPSFEEYLKQREAGASSATIAGAAAPAAAATSGRQVRSSQISFSFVFAT